MKNAILTLNLALTLAAPTYVGAAEQSASDVRVIVSESIRSMSHDAKRMKMSLRLTDGTEYRFGNISTSTYEAFRDAENRGAWFNRRIRTVYPCLQIRYPKVVDYDPHRYECTRHRYR